jgi:hypothetical protein
VNGARWLRSQIEDIITAESGASFEELAERTGASYTDVRAAVMALYGMRRADFCWGYVTAAPSPAEARRSA